MQKTIKRILSVMLIVVMTIGATPLSGFVGLELPNIFEFFNIKADAADEIVYTSGNYKYVVEDEEAKIVDFSLSEEEDIVFPPSLGGYPLTAIGDNAFSECKYLTGVVIPDNITVIEGYAFEACPKLKSVKIGNGVKEIGKLAFGNCVLLEDVELSCNLQVIGESAFTNCKSLSSIKIPSSVVTIDEHAFRSCPKLSSVFFENESQLKSIGKFSFDGCAELTEIKIPDSTEVIEEYAFYQCEELVSINIPYGVKKIGYYAFYDCQKLSDIYIPDSVADIGTCAFYNTAYYNDTSNWDSNNVLYINNHLIKANIDDSIETYRIKSGTLLIAGDAFNNEDSVKEVVMPESVKSICSRAFLSCNGLSKIKLPENVLIIGDEAFYGCTNLSEITIPNSITSIENKVFSNCTGLEKVELGEGVTRIGKGAFEKCVGLKTIEIPDNVIRVEENAFRSCTGLLSVSIGSGITKIEQYTFRDCEQLVTVSGCKNLLSIGNSAFEGCHKLVNIDVPKNLIEIGQYAFCSCGSLKTVSVPKDVQKIEAGTFKNCINLETVVLNGIITIGASAFEGCESLNEISIPDTVEVIEGKAFYECVSLKSVKFSKTITEINENTFYGCSSLENLNIPEGVTKIGAKAFYGCDSLESIIIPNSIEFLAPLAFGHCDKLADITLPDKTFETGYGYNPFEHTAYWRDESNWENGVLYIGNHLVASDRDAVSGNYIIKEGTKTVFPGGLSGNKLTGIVIPDSVLRVGTSAFSGKFETVVMGKGLTDIPAGLIDPNTLREFKIGESVTSISDSQFKTCVSLYEITIPDSVKTIGNNAFYGCLNLKSVKIGSGVEKIGKDAFYNSNCYLNEDNWIDNVLYLDKCLIVANGATGGLIIPDGTRLVADWAFNKQSTLVTVTMPDSMLYIGDYAFSGCTELVSISTGNGLKKIGNDAFGNSLYPNTKLTTVDIGDNVEYIGDYAFQSTVTNEHNLRKLKYIGTQALSSKYAHPVYLDSIEIIKEDAFYNRTSIPSIHISSSAVSIGEQAFYNCSSLESVTIEDGLKSIGKEAFYGCKKLSDIEIPDSVTFVGDNAFGGCISLTQASLGNGLENTGKEIFDECTSLKSLYLGNNIKIIDAYAFSACKSLLSVVIPDSVIEVRNGAFSGCSSLENVTIGSGVEKIGSSVFYGCDSLKEIYIPGNVVVMGGDSYKSYGGVIENPFKYMRGLVSITVSENNPNYSSDENGVLFNKDKTVLICYPAGNERKNYSVPEGVKFLGAYSFAYSQNLEEILFPDSLEIIRNSAFYYCDSLKKANISDGVTEIWHEAFYYCDSLSEITIPANIIYMGNAFDRYNEIAKINYNAVDAEVDLPLKAAQVILGNKVETLCPGMFTEFKNLKTIHIPASVRHIGKDALNCVSLESITVDENNLHYSSDDCGVLFDKNKTTLIKYPASSPITNYCVPDSVAEIQEKSFNYAKELVVVTIKNGLQSIGSNAFSYCYNLVSINISEGVTSIGSSAFAGSESLLSINIPSTVTTIESSLFRDCSSLESIILHDGITTIGSYAFSSCASLKEITIPDSVTDIGDRAFINCTGLRKALIGNGVTKLNDYTFSGCSSLISVDLPDKLDSMEELVFLNCTSLKEIFIPKTLQSVDGYDEYVSGDKRYIGGAFKNCSSLAYVEIEDGMINIPDYLFDRCSGLGSVKIPESIESIGFRAFYGCSNLLSVDIPENVTEISSSAFSGCSSLSSVDIPENVTEISSSAFSGCSTLKTVTGCEGLVRISGTAFSGNVSLAEFPFCEKLESISNYAFSYSGLKNVDLGANVTFIGVHAFGDCESLENITVNENNPNYSSDEFGVLFNKDKTIVMQYPIGNQRQSVTLPKTVKTIKSNSFGNAKSLNTITLPKELSLIEESSFPECTALKTVYYEGFESLWPYIDIKKYNTYLINAELICLEEENILCAKDDATGVNIDYVSNFYDGKVGINVKQVFDGVAFDVISTQLDIEDGSIYDITMTVDNVETQPNGTIIVRIPLPEGYDPNKTFVYHADTKDGKVKNMNAVYEDGCLVFETHHFSYYAVVEINIPYTITWVVDGTATAVEVVYGKEILLPAVPGKEGYSFTGWSPLVPETMPANDLTFTAIWSPNTYLAKFNANGGLWENAEEQKTISVEFNSEIVAPQPPIRQGYVFAGWSRNGQNIGTSLGKMDSVDGIEYVAEWILSTDTLYTVEIYKMDTCGEYSSVSTSSYKAETNSVVTATYTVPKGFSLNSEKSVLTGTVLANSALVLKVYLDRNCYSLTTVVDSTATTKYYLYEANIAPPQEPFKDGYIFTSWYPEIPSVMPAKDLIVTAKFKELSVEEWVCPRCFTAFDDENDYLNHVRVCQIVVCGECHQQFENQNELDKHIDEKHSTSILIKNNSGSKTINYGETLRLTAITTNMPADAKIYWYVDGIKQGEGETLNVSFESGTKTVEAKLVDASGNILKDASGNEISDSEKVTVKGGFFQKIISFFKNLFGMNRTVIQAFFKETF